MAVPSFTSELLSSKDVSPEAESNIKWAATSLYGGTSYPLHLIKHVILIESPCRLLVPPLVPLGGADTVRLSHIGSRVHDR